MLFGSGSGGHGNLMTKTATENGVYTAAEEIDPETGEIFNPPKDGYSVFTVDLALDDKSVTLTTSQITGSQTAEFEYDPHSENPELEGYSLFTIDLSGVKDDLEDLQQQVSDLEDELEEMQDCCEDVAEILDATPEEGESCCDAVKRKAQDAVDKIEECDQCKADVIAKLQEYDPDFDPQTCGVIPPEIDAVYDKGKDDAPEKYTFPEDDPDNPDPDRYDKIAELVGSDNLTDNDLHIIVKPMDDRYPIVPEGRHNVYYGFYDSITGAFIDRTAAFQGGLDLEHTDYVTGFRITDPSTGAYTFDLVTWNYLYNPPIWGWEHHVYTDTSRYLIGYGDPTHSYTVTNKKSS